MRAERLLRGRAHDATSDPDNVNILCETSLQKILESAREVAPELLVIDSIQTLSTEDVESSPGSISQVRGVRRHPAPLRQDHRHTRHPYRTYQ